MTIKEALDEINELKPSSYSPSLMISWLSRLDSMIVNEIDLHPYNKENFTPYGKECSQETSLLLPFPYAEEIYIPYLKMKIDFENGDIAKYNDSLSIFASSYSRFLQNFMKTARRHKRKSFKFR